MMKWLLDNIPWVFSGAGVAIILGVLSFLHSRGWFRNPLKQIEVRPIPELSQIPNLSDGPARFQFGLRLTNSQAVPILLSAIQVQLLVPPHGHRAIAPIDVLSSIGIQITFPTTLNGHGTHDFVVGLPVFDNTPRSLHCDLELHTSSTRKTGNITIEVFRDTEETQVFVGWMGRQAAFGSTRVPQGAQNLQVKFRKKLKAPPRIIQGKVRKDEQDQA